MGKFTEKKAEIAAQAKAQGNKKTFNMAAFNELGTALINEVGYTTKVVTREKGEVIEKEIKPVDDFRQAVIGHVAKKAGCDKAETERLVQETQFSTLPLYPVVSEMITEYMEAGKRFPFLQKDDVQASLTMHEEAPREKEAKNPRTQEITGTLCIPTYNKIKSTSTCPKHRITRK